MGLVRGVVKFFNVCNNQQKDIDIQLKTSGSTTGKKEKILSSINKGSFLDRLKSNGEDDDDDNDEIRKKNAGDAHKQPKWNVLREDFIMGGELKDWNKQSASTNNDDDDDDDDD